MRYNNVDDEGSAKMNTPLEVETLLDAPPLSVAANEEFTNRAQASAGWDPFEVWRTRVKAELLPLIPTPGAVVA